MSAFLAEGASVPAAVFQTLLPGLQVDFLGLGQEVRVYEPPCDGDGGESFVEELLRPVGCQGYPPRPPPG